ncbi:MAG: DUF2065 family protein [Betaproteobacteria bacterium]|jgi:uncharacterized protein|nr:DUF2065 family protein [Betaproteobacteria bacterium]
MLDDAFWLALGWLLILEGLLPLLVPLWWRRTFTQLVRLRDGQLRFIGLLSVGAGLLVHWWLG